MNKKNKFKLLAIFFVAFPTFSKANLKAKIDNNLASQSFQNGDLKEAEKRINSALESNASDPTITFNWASSQLHIVLKELSESKSKKINESQKKRLDSAHSEFTKLLSKKSRSLEQIKKELLFQNAQTLELLDKNQEALMSYYQSLNSKNVKNSPAQLELEEKTKINIAHLLNKMSSSESKKDQGEGDGEGDSQEGDSSQDQGKNGDQKNNQQSNSGGQNQREPEFSGTDVNESQAQQILNSVSNQDRQVQQRKGQQQSKQNMQDGEFGEISPRENHKPW